MRLRPALDLRWRDRFQQLSGGFIHVFSHCPEHKAGIPGGMQIGAAFSRHQDVVSASIVSERDVKRLMDISDPVAEKFQRCELLRLARAGGRQDFKILLDRRHDAGDAPGQVSEWSPSESLGRFRKCSLDLWHG